MAIDFNQVDAKVWLDQTVQFEHNGENVELKYSEVNVKVMSVWQQIARFFTEDLWDIVFFTGQRTMDITWKVAAEGEDEHTESARIRVATIVRRELTNDNIAEAKKFAVISALNPVVPAVPAAAADQSDSEEGEVVVDSPLSPAPAPAMPQPMAPASKGPSLAVAFEADENADDEADMLRTGWATLAAAAVAEGDHAQARRANRDAFEAEVLPLVEGVGDGEGTAALINQLERFADNQERMRAGGQLAARARAEIERITPAVVELPAATGTDGDVSSIS